MEPNPETQKMFIFALFVPFYTVRQLAIAAIVILQQVLQPHSPQYRNNRVFLYARSPNKSISVLILSALKRDITRLECVDFLKRSVDRKRAQRAVSVYSEESMFPVYFIAGSCHFPHCKDKIPKFRNKYSQKRNIEVSVPISTFMRL